MDIFKLERNFETNKSLNRSELIDYLHELQNFRFSKKRDDLSGAFIRDADFFKPTFTILLRTKFEFRNGKLTEYKIVPSYLGYFFLTAFPLAFVIMMIQGFVQPELQNQLGIITTGFGSLFGFFMVRKVLKLGIKSVRERLNLG